MVVAVWQFIPVQEGEVSRMGTSEQRADLGRLRTFLRDYYGGQDPAGVLMGAGIPKTTAYRWVGGTSRRRSKRADGPPPVTALPSAIHLTKMCERLRLNATWLLLGTGAPRHDSSAPGKGKLAELLRDHLVVTTQRRTKLEKERVESLMYAADTILDLVELTTADTVNHWKRLRVARPEGVLATTVGVSPMPDFEDLFPQFLDRKESS